ncbi:MAG: geranylgeranylglyceryl/heptaprenylglyceryl phosphate synthase [Candidatus Bathyarchaeota archaeon]|nr:MAG: geranylgeranylglyceryl/heptaprenylglyceryl phosphate synthase [Candidatus Bathyarchaeota archaeon]
MARALWRKSRLVGKVERYILDKIKEKRAIHMTLIDPQKTGGSDCAVIAEEAATAGSSAIMVGGSTLASKSDLDEAVKDIKSRVEVPVILFPNDVAGVSRHADAIWFMSLLNSRNTYYVIDAQALSAYTIKSYGLETLPLGYIIIGDGGTVGFIGQARGIPYDRPELAMAYSLAAQTLGMRFVYLEAGSGAKAPIPLDMIKLVRSQLTVPLIIGGGIREGAAARAAVEAGADIIVTGNLVEETKGVRESINDIISNIEDGR